jgi:hypothetical protein
MLSHNYTTISRIDLSSVPNNPELKWWGHGVDVEPIAIPGTVMRGKGEGRKTLGMPTANLLLTL